MAIRPNGGCKARRRTPTPTPGIPTKAQAEATEAALTDNTFFRTVKASIRTLPNVFAHFAQAGGVTGWWCQVCHSDKQTISLRLINRDSYLCANRPIIIEATSAIEKTRIMIVIKNESWLSE
jgi:hypothetical protein